MSMSTVGNVMKEREGGRRKREGEGGKGRREGRERREKAGHYVCPEKQHVTGYGLAKGIGNETDETSAFSRQLSGTTEHRGTRRSAPGVRNQQNPGCEKPYGPNALPRSGGTCNSETQNM